MSNNSPKSLSMRFPIDPAKMDQIRDSIASTLPGRLSEMILAIERFRRNEHLGVIGQWIGRHTHGRAFFHYQMVCHFTPELKSNVTDFCKLFDNNPKMRTAYYRMSRNWENEGWAINGVVRDWVIRSQMEATFEIMEFASI